MRFACAALAIALVAACGPRPPAGSTAPYGTVTGTVRAYPCAPVERFASPCSGRPAVRVELDFATAGKAPVRGITGAAGVYAVQLPPGTYVVTVPLRKLMAGPTTVTVKAGQTTDVNFLVDSGIR